MLLLLTACYQTSLMNYESLLEVAIKVHLGGGHDQNTLYKILKELIAVHSGCSRYFLCSANIIYNYTLHLNIHSLTNDERNGFIFIF